MSRTRTSLSCDEGEPATRGRSVVGFVAFGREALAPMTTGAKVCLLVVATLGVAAGTVHMFLPGGLGPVIDKITASKPAESTPGPATRAADRPPPANGADELRVAERAFDAGDFAAAMDAFLDARADSNPDYRERAENGLRKAVLGWALTINVVPPNEMPADPDAEVARRQREAEATPSEQVWYDLTMYAVGVGAKRKLKYLVGQTLSSALRDGPVEGRLKRVLERAGSRTTLLHDAMAAEGFITPTAPLDPVAEAAKPRGEPGAKPTPFTSGKPQITVPVGK